MKLTQKFLRWVVRRAVRQHNFLDPFKVMASAGRFSKPSEVTAPTELLRAGAIFHARGLLNSQAIQHNLDWVWPYWVQRQFDPRDPSFVPRAFSLTHINLTHRNWTAVGVPGQFHLPVVDQRSLVMPFWDSWSMDAGIHLADGRDIYLAEARDVSQTLQPDELAVITSLNTSGVSIVIKTDVVHHGGHDVCRTHYRVTSVQEGVLKIGLRPFNAEGVSFIRRIDLLSAQRWKVNGATVVDFNKAPESIVLSEYERGDAFKVSRSVTDDSFIECDVGMASASAAFAFEAGQNFEVEVEIPLVQKSGPHPHADARSSTDGKLPSPCLFKTGNSLYDNLYRSALETLLLHTHDEVWAGPYTYKRFWFRDAAFILEALTALGYHERVLRHMQRMPKRQTFQGFYLSQEGEWDANGQVLWLMGRYHSLTGLKLPDELYESAHKAGRWLSRKRLKKEKGLKHSGLLPPGFSAEHFGPNDYYYWDDFWALAGFRSLQAIAQERGDMDMVSFCSEQYADLYGCLEDSLLQVFQELKHAAMPSSPYRRMDSAAIGSLSAGYPLQVYDAGHPRLLATAEYLHEHCLVHGAFFHDMSHSGINPYLTMHLAQVFLRVGDARYWGLVDAIAHLASPTGQWPEAIHPLTRGGCMGDGQHVWAASEWLMMMRALFVREENASGSLVLCSGLHKDFLKPGQHLEFGPTQTAFGEVRISVDVSDDEVIVTWKGRWFDVRPQIVVQFPGCRAFTPDGDTLTLARKDALCVS